MNTSSLSAKKKLFETLRDVAFVRETDAQRIVHGGAGLRTNTNNWLFDMRRIFLEPETAEQIAELFWDTFNDKNSVQIGGLESGAISLVANLVAHAHYKRAQKDVSGFFVRKSRKKTGLMRHIEGIVRPNRPIILVDDLLNSGKSFVRQVEILAQEGHPVEAIWVLVRFRNPEYYAYFREKGIRVESLFELNDFTKDLGVRNLTDDMSAAPRTYFKTVWKFAAHNPNLGMIVPKSDPSIDEERVYVGSDNGVMWALNQSDGSTAWSKQIGFHVKGKGIFSSPAVHEGTLYFGGYDGNVYALDAQTGAQKWVSFEADWVGSSPALAPDLNLLFIGLEFGLWRKRGGIAALDMKTGKTIWTDRANPAYTHSTPLYLKKHQQVVIGGNDGVARLYDAKSGTPLWQFKTGEPGEAEIISGFSKFDIKESFAYDATRDRIIFGNVAGVLFFIDRTSGKEVSRFVAEFGFIATPLVSGNAVYATSVDKNLYCIDLDTFREKWRWHSGTRIFSAPTIIEGSIYVGTNAGVLSELDPETGKECSFITLSERIVNRPAYNMATKRFFVPTVANELYCVEKVEKV